MVTVCVRLMTEWKRKTQTGYKIMVIDIMSSLTVADEFINYKCIKKLLLHSATVAKMCRTDKPFVLSYVFIIVTVMFYKKRRKYMIA